MQHRIPPPLIMLAAALLMWIMDRWLPFGHWIDLPWNRLGGIPAAAGFALDGAAFLHFRRARTIVNPLDPGKASCLVTDGIYGVTRNPMYLGLVLMLIGWALWLGSASPWVIPPLFAIAMTFAQIIPEERALGQNFGAQFLEYQRRVPRWIGRRR